MTPRSPRSVANSISLVLNAAYGNDRFDHGPVDVGQLALDYTKQISPDSHIEQVVAEDLPGCDGALVPGDALPRRWAIMYDRRQNAGRRAYTIAHELGHFLLHRRLVDEDPDFDGGFHCSKEAVEHGAGADIEKEANEFAANLLMPLDDYRRQIPSDRPATFERLGGVAIRYGVSLTAATLRWLEYTTTRAMVIASVDGFALWAKSSEAALRSGRFLQTRTGLFEMPAASLAVRNAFGTEALQGVAQPAGVWFPEPVLEMCVRSGRHDFELTLLCFEARAPALQEEEVLEDTYIRFFRHASRS
ncbi:ImmA/IrrE family metallo-endopeptidase [Rhizobium sp. CC-YZS058]|uniref:ImmA/IrrE family metallo-endopeptidase n=1 Tax=Rhizobium sp. CC-YZS058 TaxID=3042153 RepID=UPI002B05BD1D|nr:ImmA/IrrE family metallo-endopeptidase [Rhizobium sp. CC-YZS058]MEA3536991.1 ImmA/IrrE family metallo-endopeptidase [Rhizobium sp. CC-YZS058]